MIAHTGFNNNYNGKRQLHGFIRRGEILLAGNGLLKIYGTLKCSSGKRMHRKNRVFFSSEEEAVLNGFRPCGNCMKEKYQLWKRHNHKPDAGKSI